MNERQLPRSINSARFWSLMVSEELMHNPNLPFTKEDWPQMQGRVPSGLVCPDLDCAGILDDRGKCPICDLDVVSCKMWLDYLQLDILESDQ